MADWRRRNPERNQATRLAYYAANTDRIKTHFAEWMRDARALKQSKRNARRARLLAAPGRGVTVKQWQAILAAHDHRCAYCGDNDAPLEMEHVVALANGGAHDVDNVVPACHPCNAKKGTTQ